MSCTLEPSIQTCDTSEQIPFFSQLSIDHNMDVHCQVKTQIVYALDTQRIMPGHYKKLLPA